MYFFQQIGIDVSCKISSYRIHRKYSDRQAWANNIDPRVVAEFEDHVPTMNHITRRLQVAVQGVVSRII